MKLIRVAAGLMVAAVALGAFGAHGLRNRLELAGHVTTWETAVFYHAVHGIALWALGIWQRVDPAAAAVSSLRFAGWLWGAGIAAFSGSLYLLSVGGPKWLGPVTPLGGLALLAGWLVVAFALPHARRGSPPAA